MTMTADDYAEMEEQLEAEGGEGEGEGEGGVKEEPFKFEGEQYAEALRGKTPEEVGRAYNEIVTAGRVLAASMQNQQVQQQPASQEVEVPKITPDDLLDENADVNSKINQMFEAKIQPYQAQLAETNAQLLYRQAMEAYPHLSEYKQEVDAWLGQQPSQVRANPATYAMINGYILNNHFDEIAAKRGKRKPPPPDFESGSGTGQGSPKADKVSLSSEQKAAVRALGVPEAKYAAALQFTDQG